MATAAVASRLPVAVRAVQTPSHVCSKFLPSRQPCMTASARLLSIAPAHNLLSMRRAEARMGRATFATVVRTVIQISHAHAGMTYQRTTRVSKLNIHFPFVSCRQQQQHQRWARRCSLT